MGSGGGGGGNPALLMQNANPMKGLPVAGEGGGIGSPFEYGKFQNFLPDIQAEGQNPMATGLRPEMFQYKSPSGVVAQSGVGDQIQELRNTLAQLQQSQQSQNNQFGAAQQGPWQHPFAGQIATDVGGGG